MDAGFGLDGAAERKKRQQENEWVAIAESGNKQRFVNAIAYLPVDGIRKRITTVRKFGE